MKKAICHNTALNLRKSVFAFCVEALVTSKETVQMNCASTAMNPVIYPSNVNDPEQDHLIAVKDVVFLVI